MGRLTSFKQSFKDKLKSLAEDVKIGESLINHYTFILEHFDEVIASHDAEIAVIDAKKEEVLQQFIAAPQELVTLAQHITKLKQKAKSIKDARSNKTGKIKRIKSLRERLAALQQECETEGIDIEQAIRDLENYKTETVKQGGSNE